MHRLSLERLNSPMYHYRILEAFLLALGMMQKGSKHQSVYATWTQRFRWLVEDGDRGERFRSREPWTCMDMLYIYKKHTQEGQIKI